MTMSPMLLAPGNNGVMDQHEQEPDPAAKPRRRTFTVEKKLAVLAEYDAADREAGKGALLRREATYASHISEWRKARARGDADWPVATQAQDRGGVELERLRKRNVKD